MANSSEPDDVVTRVRDAADNIPVDALQGATAWELAEDARLVSLFRKHGTPIPADTLDRLAALALAVSQAANTSDSRIEQAGRADYLILDIPMPETHTMGYGAC